ncbi:hypothetical protein [Kitasatospora sp. MAP5-34]|uniref:hypothetical protein n=1 Tax=Kitasatospora sp. MAP5-34 TaxID=3035102 RepID=UPI0024732EEB|nr:hypothetical protein [Kitasatospora sp. MAP5-34]MDH6577049.1 hypothetical protein [Kitasatospora sp. MAP5-34]
MSTQLEPLLPRLPRPHPSPPARATVPAFAPAVPPRRAVPAFAPIRRGSGGRHRLRQAVRHRPGVLAAGLLATATALTAGPLRPGPPPPTATSAAAGVSGAPGTAPRCPGPTSTERRQLHP